ncbi:hypothetical protein UPYG_G00029820 [Umbra pygmaea]|uniref:Uncharacterized protein n=1 Tax=Umbra pygmaea TaxID=75934 RepID=A0ABD0XPX4_UMBPY
MDDLKKKSEENAKIYSNTLERIIQKYSNLQNSDTEVNLETMTPRVVSNIMVVSKLEMSNLALCKSDADPADWSLGDISEIQRPQNTTADFHMDLSYHLDDSNNDCVEGQAKKSELKVAAENTHSVGSQLDQPRSCLWGAPEDQDEDLEQSLSSQPRTLSDMYPRMLGQLREAWWRQHMSSVAVGVLRRHHKLRWFSNKKPHYRTFDRTMRLAQRNSTFLKKSQTSLNPKGVMSKAEETSLSTSPLQLQVILPAERLSPRKKTVSPTKAPLRPESPEAASLNQTFTVLMPSYTPSLHRARLTPHVLSPARSDGPSKAAGWSSPSQRRGGLPIVPSQRVVQAQCSVGSMGTSSDPERSAHGSPAAESPYKARLLSWEGQRAASPNIPRSPVYVGYHDRNTAVPKHPPVFSLSSLQKALSPRKPLNSHSLSQLERCASQSFQLSNNLPKPKFWRSCSLDSFSQSTGLQRHLATQSNKDFEKLYHKFMCQGESSPSCRMCKRSARTTRSPSSSLAALALSPHFSVMRKRHREEVQDRSPESKRWRDNGCVYSPGSQRQMFRHQNRSENRLFHCEYSVQKDVSNTCSPCKSSFAQPYFSPHHKASDTVTRKATRCTSGLNVQQHSPAWIEKYKRFDKIQEMSHVKTVCQCGCSQSLSRRRLLYK